MPNTPCLWTLVSGDGRGRLPPKSLVRLWPSLVELQVGKTGGGGIEAQGDDAGGAVAVLGEVQLGHAPLGGGRVVQLLAVDKEHEVAILLDSTTVTEVNQQRHL
jgi:hypothetical protein